MKNTNDILWTGPRLLIPMMVDALVRTNKGNAIAFSEDPTKFNEYKNYGRMNPDPFNTVKNKPRLEPGVHLQWGLPDGLTAGVENEDGEIQYPLVPNRWMIIRFSADDPEARQAWVVESDYLGDGSVVDGNVDGWNSFLKQEGDTMVHKYLGKWYDLKDWTETGEESTLFLKATGVSDISFAAYNPNIKFVFSFHDPIDSAKSAKYSYLTTGWYSNAKEDPLYYEKTENQNGWVDQNEWLAVMQRHLWSVGDDVDLNIAKQAAETWIKANVENVDFSKTWNELPAQSLTHGLIFDVLWPGINEQPESGVPTYNPSDPASVPYASAANTGIDAISAFMQWTLNYNTNNPSENPKEDEDVGAMLQAFNYHLLPEVGATFDVPELDRAIHDDWFGTVHSGLIWLVEKPKSEGGLTPSETDQAVPELTKETSDALANINKLQETLDSSCKLKESKQSQLYMTWWKSKYYDTAFPFEAPTGYPTKKELEDLVASQKTELQKLTDSITNIQAEIDAAKANITALLSTNGNLELTSKPAASFYEPNDPTLLLSGVKRSYKHGEDLIYSHENDSLFTRFTGQFISNIDVEIAGKTSTVEGSQLAAPFPEDKNYPKEIPAMLIEAMMLDINYAKNIGTIALDGGTPSPEDILQIQQQQTLIWNSNLDSSLDQRTLEKIAGFNSGNDLIRFPSKIGVALWSPPWNPIQMRWKVAYYPAAETKEGEFTQWKFDGYDYNWNEGDNYPPNDNPAVTFKGSSVLTPKEAYTLQTQLDAFIRQYDGKIPDEYIPLQDTLDAIGKWDVLSQVMTNFKELLLQWDLGQYGYKPTDAETQIAVGDMNHGLLLNQSTDESFFPLRAGFLKITDLWVVDEYGQIYDLLVSSMDSLSVIPGMGFEPGDYKLNLQLPQFIQVPPRILQPSRLNLDFISAMNDQLKSNAVGGTTPVCGWFLPNHLNQALLVYNTEGDVLGQILLVGDTEQQHATWQPAIETGVIPTDIENRHLQDFVTSMLGLEDNGQAFTNFLATIDETQWAVNPLGNRENENLSIIVGEPIAMVRASYNLELQGETSYKMNWENSLKKDPGQLLDVKFPLQVGNIDMVSDGVMGYFVGDDYTAFNTVHFGQVETPAKPRYVVNNFLHVQAAQEPVFVSILLDPRGSILTSSGILPMLEIPLPDTYTKSALNKMQIDINTGPVLVQSEILQLNLPSGIGDDWTWYQPQQSVETAGKVEWSEIATIVDATTQAELPDLPYTFREGRLRLSGALGSKLALFFFTPNGLTPEPNTKAPTYKVTAGTKITLSWTSQAAENAQLEDGNGLSVKGLPTNEFSYEYLVRETVTLTLKVLGASQKELTLSIKLIAN
ncbi:hypothetical protein [uncultured Aquimarina sp.]|uniref:hypothetical protein n=1 Tax=uncultured Aquimarina sp. TaxID=575652 RepID=UPI0026377FF0|nr:hypothetical protein [uncultured Aquimarina sp.]